jgi:hypothetical protein
VRRRLAMPKEKPLQGKPIRGNGEALTVSKTGNNGNIIPIIAIKGLEEELSGLDYGTVSLSVYVRDGHITRFTTNRERSTVISSGVDAGETGRSSR